MRVVNNMRPDEIGMVSSKVKIISNKLLYVINNGKKIESDFKTLKENASKAYSSNNATVMDSNNGYIIDGIHVNTKNINSYNLFINKEISEYDKINNESINILKNINNNIKK